MLLQGDIKFFQLGTSKHKYFCIFPIPIFLWDYSCYCWTTEFFELSCVGWEKISPSLQGLECTKCHCILCRCSVSFFFLHKSFQLKLVEIRSCTYEPWGSWLLLAASLPCCLMTNPVIALSWNGWCRVIVVAFKWKEIIMRWKAHDNLGTKIWNQLETLSLVKAASSSCKLKP